MIFKIPWIIRAIFYRLFFKKVGLYSYLGAPIFLKGVKNISIGKRVRIFPHYRMETYHHGQIIINDNCSIGQRLHITAAEEVCIGENSTILFDVMITDIDHEYRNIDTSIPNQPFIVNKTIIGAFSYIGSGAKIQAGTILGRQCIVGANSVVRGTFPDYCVIAGVPAKIIKKYNPATKSWENFDSKKETK